MMATYSGEFGSVDAASHAALGRVISYSDLIQATRQTPSKLYRDVMQLIVFVFQNNHSQVESRYRAIMLEHGKRALGDLDMKQDVHTCQWMSTRLGEFNDIEGLRLRLV